MMLTGAYAIFAVAAAIVGLTVQQHLGAKRMSAATDRLSTSVDALTTAASNLTNAGNAVSTEIAALRGGADETAVSGAADKVDAATKTVQAAADSLNSLASPQPKAT